MSTAQTRQCSSYAGIVFVHVVLVPRLKEGDGFLMAINSILGPSLAGLAFGTME